MCHSLLEETYTLPGTSWEITTVIGLEAVRAYGVGLKRPHMHKLGQVTKIKYYLFKGRPLFCQWNWSWFCWQERWGKCSGSRFSALSKCTQMSPSQISGSHYFCTNALNLSSNVSTLTKGLMMLCSQLVLSLCSCITFILILSHVFPEAMGYDKFFKVILEVL